MPRDSLRPRKLRYGVAINDAPYKVRENGTLCPIYTCWDNMLKRCYDPIVQNKHPTYTDCTVCEEWLQFSNFHAWMVSQDWEGKELDKDLLSGESKVYSPTHCCFLPKHINSTIKDVKTGSLPLGVSYKQRSSDMTQELKRPYQARISVGGKRKQLGVFETALEAHRAWQLAKVEVLRTLALDLEPILSQAMLQLGQQIMGDYMTGIETTKLTRRPK
uniref:HNH endonuclease n=1 Tax=Klebsiella phage FKP3 TaxID=3231233 RepID=A0AAU8HZZ2_9CAUD